MLGYCKHFSHAFDSAFSWIQYGYFLSTPLNAEVDGLCLYFKNLLTYKTATFPSVSYFIKTLVPRYIHKAVLRNECKCQIVVFLAICHRVLLCILIFVLLYFCS